MLRRLFRVATEAVAPERLVESHLRRDVGRALLSGLSGGDLHLPLPVRVFGAGKAAARMAKGCELILGADNCSGFVITADGCETDLASIECRTSGHPLPDNRGLAAGRAMLDMLHATADPVLFLLSGGASSLLVQPRPPVSLEDKVATSMALLACGAEIREFNTVRKHLSLVKGGGLLRYAAGSVHTLVLSDVVGDDPAVIGSGPTFPDPTTFADAYGILDRYHLLDRVPRTVRDLLVAGTEGRCAETVKPNDAEASRSMVQIVGSNRVALDAAATAVPRGWRVERLEEPLQGDTREAAEHFAMAIGRAARNHQGSSDPVCLLAGGETTVRVSGPGRGGRNQEFALAVAAAIHDQPVSVLSAGSDGIDGPTDAAGAFADGSTMARAARVGLDPEAYLRDNDSYQFFHRLGDLFRPGPTGTNVMDLKFAVIGHTT